MPTIWTNHPLYPGAAMLAAHVNELRLVVDEAGGTPVGGWTDGSTVTTSTPIRAKHLTELRDAVGEMWDQVGLGTLPSWSAPEAPGGPSLGTSATPLRADHVNDLRQWISEFETAVWAFLDPPVLVLSVDQIEEITIFVEAGDSHLTTVHLSLDFDPSLLQVTDGLGNPLTEISPGSALQDVLLNQVNNALGQIDYAAGIHTVPPKGSIGIASFAVKAIATGTGTITFTDGSGRPTVLANYLHVYRSRKSSTSITIV